jgi:7-carboxy-7-deazaguanine synthase
MSREGIYTAMTTNLPQLSISEHFGPTLQGEGISAGKPAYFIRLGLCNLDCKWCDTPYTWDWTGKNGYAYSKAIELRRLSILEIANFVPATCRLVVITGGEPMVQQTHLLGLVHVLRQRGHVIEIETNGTITPQSADWLALASEYSDLGVQFNVSPKLSNSGVAVDKAIDIDALEQYVHLGAVFKFVVQGEQCIEEVKWLCARLGLPASAVYLMPEGRTQQQLLERMPWVFGACLAYGYNLSARLHTLAFNDERGV